MLSLVAPVCKDQSTRHSTYYYWVAQSLCRPLSSHSPQSCRRVLSHALWSRGSCSCPSCGTGGWPWFVGLGPAIFLCRSLWFSWMIRWCLCGSSTGDKGRIPSRVLWNFAVNSIEPSERMDCVASLHCQEFCALSFKTLVRLRFLGRSAPILRDTSPHQILSPNFSQFTAAFQ